jgi:probable O-glycosylation ligase (exosortase A-associated)
MRDIIILGIIFGSVPLCFINPYFGVLMWTWISYFNPHRYAWASTVYNFPVAMVVAIPTLLGLPLNSKLNRHIFARESLLILALWIWMVISLVYASQVPLFSGHIEDGTASLIQITKILLMTFVTMFLVNSKSRFRQLVFVIALSFGVRAVWASIFGIQTAGESRVFGPRDSFIADNNDFALALNMILPLLHFLAVGESNRWVRRGLQLCFLASIFCVILTYSRGGLLGLATVLFLIAMMSRYRVVGLALVGALTLLTLSFAPEAWTHRMDNMAHGEVDSSGRQRLIAWRTGWNLAMDYPITGGGLQAFPDVAVFQRYEPEKMPGERKSSGPHSIYFQVLGEEGFVGLALFLALIGSCFFSIRRLRRKARSRSADHWVISYTRMFEVSLVAFAVNGAFLGRAYFDLFYEIIACIVLLKVLYQHEIAGHPSPMDINIRTELSILTTQPDVRIEQPTLANST